jgi:hypothetical protein
MLIKIPNIKIFFKTSIRFLENAQYIPLYFNHFYIIQSTHPPFKQIQRYDKGLRKINREI